MGVPVDEIIVLMLEMFCAGRHVMFLTYGIPLGCCRTNVAAERAGLYVEYRYIQT